jgi:signal peptidase I
VSDNSSIKILRGIADELLEAGTSVRIEAGGYSMYPVIKPGNSIVIRPVSASDLKPGMIIAWRRDNDMVVHRLVSIYDAGGRTMYLTRGDSSPAFDDPVEFSEIAGRVEAVYRADYLFRPPRLYPIPERRYRANRLMVRIIHLWNALVRRLTPGRKRVTAV